MAMDDKKPADMDQDKIVTESKVELGDDHEVDAAKTDAAVDLSCTEKIESSSIDCQMSVQNDNCDIAKQESFEAKHDKENGNDIALVRLPKLAYTVFEIGSGVHVAPVCLPWGQLSNGEVAKYPSGVL